MFVGFAGLILNDERGIARAFDAIEAFWRRSCGGQKVYCVIDYTNFSLDVAMTDVYATHVKHAVENYTITTIRYTTDVSTRATLRAVAIKTHNASNIYATKEDAVAIVRGLRINRIRVA
jgi:hypothetical protein